MIVLHIEPYCENCPDFEAVTDMHTGLCIDGKYITRCAVKCKDTYRCAKIYEFLEKKFNMPEEKKDGNTN